MNSNFLNFNESLEEWRDIECFDGLYNVSTYGRIKSVERTSSDNNGKYNSRTRVLKERILTPTKNKKGYLKVKLYKNGVGKNFQVHRLVAQAFIPNPNDLPQVNHKDENKQNNHVENLEWCTCEYNNNYGTRNERLSNPVGQFDKNTMELIATFSSTHQIERELGYNHSSIAHCCNNKPHYKTAYGYIWRYL